MSAPLDGAVIVVTRPRAQAQRLVDLIESGGGKAVRFPALEIEQAEADTGLKNTLGHLDQFDMAIFISANAVEYGATLLKQCNGALPEGITLAAVGKSTAEALDKQWQRPILTPAQGFNSEALLELEALQQVAERRIVIFRGCGGRELLAETLSARGAQVTYAEVYRRCRPAATLETLTRLARVDLITATSNESLKNLHEMADDEGTRSWLLSHPLVVISERTKTLARTLGFEADIEIAAEAGDPGLYNAIVSWWTRHHRQS